MAAKDIKYTDEARRSVLAGVDLMLRSNPWQIG
jgi:hypothetical protein